MNDDELWAVFCDILMQQFGGNIIWYTININHCICMYIYVDIF